MSDAQEFCRDVQVVVDAIFTHRDLHGLVADHIVDHFTKEDGSLDVERLLDAQRVPMVAMIGSIANGAGVPEHVIVDDIKRRADALALGGDVE